MKRLVILFFILIFFLTSCSTFNRIDLLEEKVNYLRQAIVDNTKSITIHNKKIIPLFEDAKAPVGVEVLEAPFSSQELVDAMSSGERAVYIRVFTGITGGATGDMDVIANADLDDNDLALVFDIQGDHSANTMLMYMWDEDLDVSELSPRYVESDTDGGSSGTWQLMSGWTSGPTATPSVVFRDSDAAGTDEWADLLAGSINFNMSVTTEGAEIVDWNIKSMIGGTEVIVLEWDGDGEVLTMGDSSTGEDLYFDFETATDNEVEVRSNSGVTQLDWGTLAFLTGSITATGTIEATTLTEGGNAVYNSTETPGGELGGTWASPTIDDNITVSGWTLDALTSITIPTTTSGDQTLTSGKIGLKTDEDLIAVHVGANGEVTDEAGISLINKTIIPMDPEKWYDNTTNNIGPGWKIGDESPHGITITEWSVTYVNGDPTTELDADIICDSTPDFNPAAGATVMDVIDTTAGASSADTGFDSATCANGNYIYVRFGADPTDSGEIVHIEISHYNNED